MVERLTLRAKIFQRKESVSSCGFCLHIVHTCDGCIHHISADQPSRYDPTGELDNGADHFACRMYLLQRVVTRHSTLFQRRVICVCSWCETSDNSPEFAPACVTGCQ